MRRTGRIQTVHPREKIVHAAQDFVHGGTGDFVKGLPPKGLRQARPLLVSFVEV